MTSITFAQSVWHEKTSVNSDLIPHGDVHGAPRRLGVANSQEIGLALGLTVFGIECPKALLRRPQQSNAYIYKDTLKRGC